MPMKYRVLIAGIWAAASVAAAGPAPDFTLTDAYSQPVSIKAYRGAVVWLTFGSTW